MTQINQTREHSSGPKGGNVGDMLDELERASLEAGRDRSCLLLFRKIYCGDKADDFCCDMRFKV